MKLSVICPAGHPFSVSRSHQGKRVSCPECQRSVIVPKTKPTTNPTTKPASKPASKTAAKTQTKPTAKARPAAAVPVRKDRSDPTQQDLADTEHPQLEQPPADRRDVVPEARPAPPVVTAPPVATRTIDQLRDIVGQLLRKQTVIYAADNIEDAGYRADRNKVTSVRWLAVYLLMTAVLGALPAVRHLDLDGAPWWKIIALLIAVAQIIYIGWMVSLPDWSTVWVLMLVFAVSAALYGCAFALALGSKPAASTLLNLYPLRQLAIPWCGAMVLLTFLGAYLCGRLSSRWHHSWAAVAAARSS